MRRFWLPLIVVLALLTEASAFGQITQSPEQKLTAILAQFSSPYIVNPQFKCWHMGRLQAYSDVLRVTGNPLHLKADAIADKYIQDCDPTFAPEYRLQTKSDLARKMVLVVKRLRGIGLEDLVPACFHTGRLSVLTGALSEHLQDTNLNRKFHKLYGVSSKEVRIRSQDCKAQSIY